MKAIVLYYSRSGNTERIAERIHTDLSAYDVVFLYPVWAQDMPVFVAEFMKQCDVTGKTVIPFVTYGMTGINWTRK